jgi:hypothetical protein
MAVCMGTENATASAQSTGSLVHGSTDVSSVRTSCPAPVRAAAGAARCNG